MPPRNKMIPTTFDEHLANVVESKRAKTHLTVDELADACGIAYQTMRRRLAGAPFTVNEIERVAVVVNVPASGLVDEALRDYGGLAKLMEEDGPKPKKPVLSVVPNTVDPSDGVEYSGHIDPGMKHAADTEPRKGE